MSTITPEQKNSILDALQYIEWYKDDKYYYASENNCSAFTTESINKLNETIKHLKEILVNN